MMDHSSRMDTEQNRYSHYCCVCSMLLHYHGVRRRTGRIKDGQEDVNLTCDRTMTSAIMQTTGVSIECWCFGLEKKRQCISRVVVSSRHWHRDVLTMIFQLRPYRKTIEPICLVFVHEIAHTITFLTERLQGTFTSFVLDSCHSSSQLNAQEAFHFSKIVLTRTLDLGT